MITNLYRVEVSLSDDSGIERDMPEKQAKAFAARIIRSTKGAISDDWCTYTGYVVTADFESLALAQKCEAKLNKMATKYRK